MKAKIRSLDHFVSTHIATWPRDWLNFFMVITILGTPGLTFFISGALMAVGLLYESVELFSFGIIAFITLWSANILKRTFRRKRPDTHYANTKLMRSYSFPSGHSVGAVIIYGTFALIAIQYLPQPYAFFAALDFTALAIIIGISRIYLGAHYASDVLAGLLIGAVGVACIYLVNPSIIA